MQAEGTVEGLKTTIAQAVEEIGKVQSALGLSRDRAQQTRDILNRATDGSVRDETAAANAAMQAIDDLVQEAINASLLGVEHLETWASTL
jgi:hypothetical protein